jgi:hypothetical protein
MIRLVALLLLASTSMVRAQSDPATTGVNNLVQCALVGSFQGTKLWAGDCLPANAPRKPLTIRVPSTAPNVVPTTKN